MDNFSDKILFQTRQHKIVLLFKFIKLFFIFVIPASFLSFFLFKLWTIITLVIAVIISLLSFAWIYFFWNKSYFLISNKKISLKVRNWIFSKFHMSIYFKNIKDIAYSKNNIMHYMFNYWTIFARSSAWATWDFEWTALPNVEKIYKYINNIYLLSEEKREILDSLEILDWNKDIVEKLQKEETFEEIIEKEKNTLLNIQWIKEVVLLDDKDRAYIFENEEDINHWVYESLRKKVLFVITHDSSFRNPDESIVLKKWDKVIFPTVKFHEIKREWVLSSSPWLKVHKFLESKFDNLWKFDATILVGFDI